MHVTEWMETFIGTECEGFTAVHEEERGHFKVNWCTELIDIKQSMDLSSSITSESFKSGMSYELIMCSLSFEVHMYNPAC